MKRIPFFTGVFMMALVIISVLVWGASQIDINKITPYLIIGCGTVYILLSIGLLLWGILADDTPARSIDMRMAHHNMQKVIEDYYSPSTTRRYYHDNTLARPRTRAHIKRNI